MQNRIISIRTCLMRLRCALHGSLHQRIDAACLGHTCIVINIFNSIIMHDFTAFPNAALQPESLRLWVYLISRPDPYSRIAGETPRSWSRSQLRFDFELEVTCNNWALTVNLLVAEQTCNWKSPEVAWRCMSWSLAVDWCPSIKNDTPDNC